MAAARAVGGKTVTDLDLAIALLRARHAKLLHIAAKVERMLAKLEQGEAVQS